jgi:hypothetical protein
MALPAGGFCNQNVNIFLQLRGTRLNGCYTNMQLQLDSTRVSISLLTAISFIEEYYWINHRDVQNTAE